MKSTSTYHAGSITRYSKLFITIISIALLSFIIYLFYAGCTLRQSQKEIVRSYEKHIAQADSVATHHNAYAASNVFNVQEVANKIVVDSLIKASLGSKSISISQTQVLIDVISQHFKEQSDFRKEYFVKFKQDSLLLYAERNAVTDQTKQMLDLHLGKVEHEYSNITIWAAILTVIFLVFSFYSIFKMDELIKQGDDGLKEIRKIRDDGRTAVDNFKSDSQTELNNIRTKTTESLQKYDESVAKYINQLNTKTSNIEGQHKQSLEQLIGLRTAFEEQSSKILEAFKTELSKHSSVYQSEVETKLAELNGYIEVAKQASKKSNKKPLETPKA